MELLKRKHEWVEEWGTTPRLRRYDLVTADELASLVAFRTERHPVLSLYMDVTPPERQNRKHLAKFKCLVRKAQEHVGSRWHGQRDVLEDQIARLFAVYMGEIEEYTGLLDEVVPRPKAGGWSAEKYQRHHDVHVLWHVKNAVDALEDFYAAQECNWLVIGGTEEPVAELRAQLPKALQERLAGEISISLKAGADEVLSRLLEIERENERRVEAERVERLITTALKDGPAVLGLAHTLVALVEGRVMTLIVASGFREAGFECDNCGYLMTAEHPSCPLCGAGLTALADVVERAVERVLAQGAEIEVLRGEARDRLVARGHIGALLRY